MRTMKQKTKSNALSAAVCALACALVIAGAFIKIPLAPIAITLQLEFVLLSALLIGAARASAAVGAYILLGLCGVPVFTQGGGIAYVLKPSFGFIVSFLVAAAVTGALSSRLSKRGFPGLYAACLAGTAVIYVCGVVYFYLITKFYLNTYPGFMGMMSACVFTTLPIDIVLCIPIAWAAKRLTPAIRRYIG